MVCTIVDSNYTGSVTNTLTVAQATATVQLCKLVQAWSGNPCRPSVVTVPVGLNVNISYDGSNQPPAKSDITLSWLTTQIAPERFLPRSG